MKGFLGSARVHKWMIRLAGPAALFGLGGCDADVRDSLVTGVQGAATGLVTTLIEALFQSFLSDQLDSGTTTTVNAVFEDLVRWMA